ncbi:hypothetical protein VIGAN_03158400 [Vigna angularis var. angularis]|uniref:Uncharacterized protein n=1 Tax=Vigna angularis var. angularis TaxID=157739 RepID=A0A0S3RM99_PHAAN|nr:hypothetical protein VIGAN_03158400 [Vigna angularis var. angularis]
MATNRISIVMSKSPYRSSLLIQMCMSKRKVREPVNLGPYQMGKVLGEVIYSMGLAPVHLVLHNSALGLNADFVSQRAELVRSMTLIDAASYGVFLFGCWRFL